MHDKSTRPYYTCKRYRLLEYLLDRGFKPYATLPDPDNPRYKVWRFHNTPELREAVEAYFSAIKK